MPLQRRLFVQARSPPKAYSTDAHENTPQRTRPARNLAQGLSGSLRARNAACYSENLRVVAVFRNEEDSPKLEGLSDKDACEERGGSANSPHGAQRLDQTGEATSSAAIGGGLSRGSLPPLSPGRKPALNSASQEYGCPPGSLLQMSSLGQSHFTSQLSQQGAQSKDSSDRIMVALCQQAYHGVRQVQRQVYLGDDRMGSKAFSASGHSAPSSPSGGNAGRLRTETKGSAANEAETSGNNADGNRSRMRTMTAGTEGDVTGTEEATGAVAPTSDESNVE